jgi:hypothetical protein
MTYTSARQSRTRSFRPPPATHLFGIGQAVRLRGSFGTFPKTSEVYRITRTLPPRGDSLQYRIRNDDERHERVATQDSLEPVRLSQSTEGATLIERTFGHGQGTETQQSRDQEAETEKGAGQA